LKDAGLVQVGVGQYLPKQFECMQVGVSWEPVMQWRSGRVLAGSQPQQIMGCQSLCARTEGCEHFTMDVGIRTCKLAGSEAVPLPGVFNSISGPPVCVDAARTFMRKFSEARMTHLQPKFMAIGILGFGLTAVGSVAILYRRIKQVDTTRSLMMTDE